MAVEHPTLQFRIHGMDCVEEVAVLKREVGPVVGGAGNLAFDILNAKMSVAAGSPATAEAVGAAVARTGMRAEPWRDEKTALTREDFWERNRRTILTTAGGALLALTLVVHGIVSGFPAAFGLSEAAACPPWGSVILYVERRLELLSADN